MVSKSAQGAWMIAGAFVVYAVLEAASVYTDAPVWIASIGGTILLWLGGRRILRAQAAHKGFQIATIVVLLLGFLAGRTAWTLLRDAETVEQIQTGIGVSVVQMFLFSLAAAVVLWSKGSSLVRILSVVALAGLGPYTFLTFGLFDGLVEGTLLLEGFQTQYLAVSLLMTLMWIPALVYALQSPKDAPAGPGANPFAARAGVPQRPIQGNPAARPALAKTPVVTASKPPVTAARAPAGSPKPPVTAPRPAGSGKPPATNAPKPGLARPQGPPRTVTPGPQTGRPLMGSPPVRPGAK